MVPSLQKFRYRPTSAVTKFVGKWLQEIFAVRVDDFSRLMVGLFSFLLFLSLYSFSPSSWSHSLYSYSLVPLSPLVFGITTSAIRPGASHVPSFYAPAGLARPSLLSSASSSGVYAASVGISSTQLTQNRPSDGRPHRQSLHQSTSSWPLAPARLSLIAQALALLRNQPSIALVVVDWTKYVPHLFSQ